MVHTTPCNLYMGKLWRTQIICESIFAAPISLYDRLTNLGSEYEPLKTR